MILPFPKIHEEAAWGMRERASEGIVTPALELKAHGRRTRRRRRRRRGRRRRHAINVCERLAPTSATMKHLIAP